MNPYEAPQTPLQPEPEVRPRVPVVYETYDAFEMLKIIGVILLVLIEVCLGVLLLQGISIAVGLDSGGENVGMVGLLPYASTGFVSIGWILWKLKQASDRKNS